MNEFINSKIIFGDGCEKMKTIPDGSVSLVLADLPYEKTKNVWDKIIDPSLLWGEYWRILKPNGVVFLFGQDKFTAMMMLSDPNHRYNLIWEKSTVTGYLNAKKMPLRCHEDMMIFYKALPTYNPQKTTGHKRKVSTAKHKRNSKKTTNYGEHGLTTYDSSERYPRSIWAFPTDKQKNPLTPTQKPVALFKEIILTYSNVGDIILDNVAGSGTTGEACIALDRDFILIEKYHDTFQIMKRRIGNIFIDIGLNIETITYE